MSKCVCGQCMNTKYSDKNGNCGVCGADHWVEARDFTDPLLNEYIEEACTNLGISRKDLETLCLSL